MARRPTGQVIPPNGKQRSWAIRFRAYGKREFVSLGKPEDGWNRQKAEAELRHVLADVERGTWHPYEPEPIEAPREVPTFHEFASEWLANREPELRAKTVASYRWQLSDHLLPHLASLPVTAIKAEVVDAYKATKLREGRIGPNQINKTLGTLSRILRAARRYGYLDSNPMEDVDRLRGTRPRPAVPVPEQLPALLKAAGALRPVLATLAGAGLRNGEACALDWPDVNLATGTIRVRESKTAAGVRLVDVPLALREELSDHKARSPQTGSGEALFVNRKGHRQTVSNIERRFKTAIRRANVRLCELGVEPISEKVTPHSLRHLYASLRAAVGDDPVYIAEQGGWTDPAFALRVYARAVKRRERLTGTALREFDAALQWAEMGRISDSADTLDPLADAPDAAIPGVERDPATSPDSSAG
jgi:integrase